MVVLNTRDVISTKKHSSIGYIKQLVYYDVLSNNKTLCDTYKDLYNIISRDDINTFNIIFNKLPSFSNADNFNDLFTIAPGGYNDNDDDFEEWY
jgi:hypothetical protein